MKIFIAVTLLLLIVRLKAEEYPRIRPLAYYNTVPIYESSTNISDSFVYQVCGNETKLTDCTCINETIECKPSSNPHYMYWFDMTNPPFVSMNIQILKESFVPKNVVFQHNHISKLLKDKVLSGSETFVESMELTYNQLEEIENGTFDKFVSLKTLNLEYNQLKNLSAGILTKQLGSTLTALKIGANEFQCFSVIDFSNMVKLQELDLSKNGHIGYFGNVSKFIFPSALSNLKSLDLSQCGISTLNDDVFMNLVTLETLNLNENPISSFPKATSALSNLRNLNLQSTRISSINKTEFQAFTNLESFDLTYSMLSKIEDCTFCNKSNLKSVMLYGNSRLSFIHENAFGNAFNQTLSPLMLESFSVEYCNLSVIPENLLNWHTVQGYGLGKNPFTCNCSMAWLINDILSPTHSMNLKSFLPAAHGRYSWQDQADENAFKCFGPYALKNIPFSHISRKLRCDIPKMPKLIYVEKEISMFAVFLLISACSFTFILGLLAAPVFHRLLSSKTSSNDIQIGFNNQNHPDNQAADDFDEVKIYV